MSNEPSFYKSGYGENKSESCVSKTLYALSMIFIILFFPFTIWFCLLIIAEYQRIIILRNGKLMKKKIRGPGVIFVVPCVDEWTRIDLRTETIDVPAQDVITKDSATIAVNAVVYFRVFDPLLAVLAVRNYRSSSNLLAMTLLRTIIGSRNLFEILTDRASIIKELMGLLEEGTNPWGIKIERVEIKDVCLPRDLQRAMAAEAEATREARAKVIAAEGELKASRNLKEASDVMAACPTALTLRYLQTLNTIAAEKQSTVIFPLPIEIMPETISK